MLEVLFALVLLGIGIMGLQALGIASARTLGQAEIRSEYAMAATQELEKGLFSARQGNCVTPSPNTVTLQNGDVVTTDLAGVNAGGTCTVTVTVTSASGALGTYTLTANVYLP